MSLNIEHFIIRLCCSLALCFLHSSSHIDVQMITIMDDSFYDVYMYPLHQVILKILFNACVPSW